MLNTAIGSGMQPLFVAQMRLVVCVILLPARSLVVYNAGLGESLHMDSV